MALSKEFYLDEIRSKYPNSYNEGLKDLPVKDLEDMLDFLDQALGKADGGSIGIEVLFGPKVPAAPSQLVSESDILLGYRGDAGYRSGSAQASSIGQGNVGSKASFGGGKGRDRSGRDEGASGAQVSQALESQRLQNIANQNKSNAMFDTAKNVYGIISPFINPGSTLGKAKKVLDTYNYLKDIKDISEEDLILGMGDQPLPSDNLLAFEPGSKKDKQLKSLFKEKGLTEDIGIPFEPKKEKKLQELMKEDQEQTDFPKTELLKAKDGGRVGLFMGGPALEGQALSIYNSMNAYGFSDQQIADALSARGLYTAADSGTTQPEQVTGIIGSQINQGGDDKPMIQSFKKDPRVAPAFEAFQTDQQLKSMGIDNPFANEASLEGAYYGDMMDNIVTDKKYSPGKQSIFAKAKEGIVGSVKGLMDNPVTNAIGFALNPIMGGIKGIASFANQMLPVNKRAIAENIGGNMGISVDNIGRIVNTGNYQDPSNVMAGYNLNMLTDKSFDDRISNISETLADKYNLSLTEIQGILEGTLSEKELTDINSRAIMPGTKQTTNLIKQLRSINIAKDRNKFIQETAQKEAERQELAKQLARAQKEIAAKGYIDYGSGGGRDESLNQGPGGSYTGKGDTGTPGLDSIDYDLKDGGLIGYNKGGLATMFTRRR